MEPLLTTIAGILVAASFGSMIFFAAVVAPTVFARLPEDVSGPFIRAIFPRYYLVLGITTALAAAAAFGERPILAVVLGATCAGFVYARQALMPRINRLRDQELAGDASAASAFQRAHYRSVVLNMVQMLALLVVLVLVLE